MAEINYAYAETVNKNVKPQGADWEYWGDRITPSEHVAVWRRDADIYGYGELQE